MGAKKKLSKCKNVNVESENFDMQKLADLDSGLRDLFKDLDIDESKLEVRIKIKKENKPKKVGKLQFGKIEHHMTKLSDAMERFKKSENKKNTVYLHNNLKAMEAQVHRAIKLLGYTEENKE